jgi:hypothetical protein
MLRERALLPLLHRKNQTSSLEEVIGQCRLVLACLGTSEQQLEPAFL